MSSSNWSPLDKYVRVSLHIDIFGIRQISCCGSIKDSEDIAEELVSNKRPTSGTFLIFTLNKNRSS